jgi:hypothetical protein
MKWVIEEEVFDENYIDDSFMVTLARGPFEAIICVTAEFVMTGAV